MVKINLENKIIQDNPTHIKMRKVIKVYLFITLLAAVAFSLVSAYISFDINRQAEYCAYVKEETFYHVMHSNQPCLLQWKLLIETLERLFLFLFIFQGPAWILFLWLKRKTMEK